MIGENRQIVIACTFRDFDGSPNDAIQRRFLDSLKSQTYQNFVLAVTNFRETTVKDVLKETGLRYVFVQSESDLLFCTTETWYNASSLLKSGRSIFFFTCVDHVFPENFLHTIVASMPEMGSVVSFPQKIYDTLADFVEGQSLETTLRAPTIERGRVEFTVDSKLPEIFRTDPNNWLPDCVALDGDLMLRPGIRDFLLKYPQLDCGPGVAHNIILGFQAEPSKRRNIAFQIRYAEILNDYGADKTADLSGKTYSEIREYQFREHEKNWAALINFGKAIGLPEADYTLQPFLKLDQVSTYEPVGDAEQKLAFQAYLLFWRLRYQISHGTVVGNQVMTNLAEIMWLPYVTENDAATVSLEIAQSYLERITSALHNFSSTKVLEQIDFGSYENIWLYGTGEGGSLTHKALVAMGVDIRGVADTYYHGSWLGHEVLAPETLAATLVEGDVILIASMYWEEISLTLERLDVKNEMLHVQVEGGVPSSMDVGKVLSGVF